MATESDQHPSGRKKPNLASVLVPVAGILAVILVVLSILRESDRRNHEKSPAGHSDAPFQRKVGEVVPDFDLTSLDGKVTHFKDLNAKVVLLNFWATWCGPCVKEMPSLQKLSDEYSSSGLKVIGVNLDEDPENVLDKFLKKHEIKFTSYVDIKGTLADRFNVSGLPLTLVLSGEGKLLMEQTGEEDWYDSSVRKQFEIWLAGVTTK